MNIFRTISGLTKNSTFVTAVGTGIAGAAVGSAKNLPEIAKNAYRRWLTVSVTIRSSQEAFTAVDQWISAREFMQSARHLQLAEVTNDADDDGRDTKSWHFTLGPGTHYIWYNGRPLWISRQREEKAKGGYNRAVDETITLTTIGTKQQVLRDLVEEAQREAQGAERIRVYYYDDYYYRLADTKTKRDLSTVFIPQEQKDRLVADLERFYASKATYLRRGTPWRRGYLLRGIPGTGKTSFIFALAGAFNKDIYVINLANVGGDNGLQSALSRVPSSGIVLMEDIDSVKVTHDREAVTDKEDLSTDQDKGTLTLAGVLNAIDGVASKEGRVLFMTSNHADMLDAALLRPGRIDVDETIGEIQGEEARAMTKAFLPDAGEDDFLALVAPKLPMPAASLQNLLQTMMDNPFA